MTATEQYQIKRKSKTFCCYHANCADGFSAYWVVNKALTIQENSCEGIPGTYGKPFPADKLEHGDTLYLVDFSLPLDTIEELTNNGVDVVWIDHHQTAWDMYKDSLHLFLNYSFSLDKSGATLAWEFFRHEFNYAGLEKPLLLDHIEDRDLWKFKLAGTKELSEEIFSFEYTLENWDMLMSADVIALAKMTASGAGILRKHMKDVNELIAVGKTTLCIDEFNVPCVNVPYMMASDAGHILGEGQPFAATYTIQDATAVFSLRSSPSGEDVSLIAKRFGGGGHKHAAGFKIAVRDISWWPAAISIHSEGYGQCLNVEGVPER